MFGSFQENITPRDVDPTEFECPESISKTELSVEVLKFKLEEIFKPDTRELTEPRPDISTDAPFDERESKTVTLDDGAVVKLPDSADKTENLSITDTSTN